MTSIKRLKFLLYFFVFLSLFSFSGLLFLLLKSQTPSNTGDIRKQVKIVDAKSNIAEINSTMHGYKIVYDKTIWNLDSVTNDTKRSAFYAFSTTSAGKDNVQIFFSVFGPETWADVVRGGIDHPEYKAIKSDLDLALKDYQYYLSEGNVFSKMYKIKDVKKVLFGKQEYYEITQDKYVTLGDKTYTHSEKVFLTSAFGRFFRATLNYDQTDTPNYNQALSFVRNISYADPANGESKNVKGVSTEAAYEDDVKVVAITKPSVVHVYTKYCAQIKINFKSPDITKQEYPYCIGGLGTGFFINSKGYIATNGHVVKIFTEQAFISALSSGKLDELILNILTMGKTPAEKLLIAEQFNKIKTDKRFYYQVATDLIGMIQKKIIAIDSEDQQIFVQLGNKPFRIKRDYSLNEADNIMPARLVALDYANPINEENGFVSSDVALIKIEGNDFPALSLGSLENVQSGLKLLVIGYPGVAEDPSLIDTETSDPTVTRGIVSAIKKSSGNKKNLVQTDASINHGNSGGPGLNSLGQVIGIATYGLTPEEGGGNYNFLRDIADLRALMSQYQVTNDSGSTTKTWASAINNLWNKKYQLAVDDLNQARSKYPFFSDYEIFLKDAKSKAGTSEDKSVEVPVTKSFSLTPTEISLIVGGILLTISVLGVIFLGLKIRSQQKELKNLEAKLPQPPINQPLA